jgi:N-methylhydantoinase A
MQWLGVDVGGTFTDLVLYDQATGALQVEKVPSTPADPSAGILAGIARLGIDLASLGKFVHGTTVRRRVAWSPPTRSSNGRARTPRC